MKKKNNNYETNYNYNEKKYDLDVNPLDVLNKFKSKSIDDNLLVLSHQKGLINKYNSTPNINTFNNKRKLLYDVKKDMNEYNIPWYENYSYIL